MKGVIFNVVGEVVTELYDADTWDDLLAGAGLDGAYTALGNYSDEELVAIVGIAAEVTSQSTDDVLRLIGRRALPKLASRLDASMLEAHDARSFLLSVNDIIHPEVRMPYPDAVPPVFDFTELETGELDVVYRSARRLDSLAELSRVLPSH